MAVTSEAPAAAGQIRYEDLYARWERGNWSAMEIDLAEDRRQWQERFSELERRAALWNYSLFFHGEDAVADDLGPLIDAAPRIEQKYFLATQQVDEARHAILFKRFMHEVVGAGDGSIASTLDATRPELSWGFRKTFELLDRITGELRRDRSRTALARAVTMYHVVVEGALAQPGQHFITDYLNERDLLPGFRAGMRNVSLDEQRHIAFGVRLLHDLAAEDPEVPAAVGELLNEVLPYTVAVFVPPNWDRRYAECFGFTMEEIFEDGARSLEAKLKAAGLALETLPGPITFGVGIPPAERARRGLGMLQAGLLGEKTGPPRSDPESMELLFESMRNAVDHAHAPSRELVLQWDFTDAQPWHMRIDNGSTAIAQGRVERADIALRCRYEDWVDLVAKRIDPRRLVATRRLRMRGSPRMLWRMRKLFAG